MSENFTISHGIIFTPDNDFKTGDLSISDGFIVDDTFTDAEIINAENLYIIPGLTDIHFHGCKGHDFCEGTLDAFNVIANYEASIGVTTICPATMTLPEDDLTRIMKAAKDFHDECINFVGINLEGPFISREKKGAQNQDYIAKPDVNFLQGLQNSSGGIIKFAVVAPEVDGAFEFIQAAKNITKISLAHTACDYETAKRAFELGINHVTHLYNAMNPINHRAPGPIIAALEDENVEVELICDGIHVHPAMVRNTIKLFGDDRVIFISDSMEATGMPDGMYELGGQKVSKRGNKATLEDGVTIAGSVTNLFDCMINAVKNMGVSLEVAVKCAAVNSVKSIGLENLYGRIQAGHVANLIALDKNLRRVWVMNHGRIIAIHRPEINDNIYREKMEVNKFCQL